MATSSLSSRISPEGLADAAVGSREGRAMLKGQQTKAAIVDAALGLATQIGM